MKKVSAILLIGILLLGTVGVTVNKHYCGGKLASLSLFSMEGCECGGMDDDSDCCTHEIETIGLGDDISQENLDFELNPQSFSIIVAYCYTFVNEESSVELDEQIIKPPLLRHDITLLVQSFLI
jgi:hypothetical protein